MRSRIITAAAAALVAATALTPGVNGQPPGASAATAAAQRTEAETQIRAYDQNLQELQRLLRETAGLGLSTAAVQQKIKETEQYRNQWAQRFAQLGGNAGRPAVGGGGGGLSLLGVKSDTARPGGR
jgi:hypothetical protein